MNPNGAHQTDVKETTIETTQFQKPCVISFESSVYFMPDAKVTTTKLIKCYDIVSKRFVIVISFFLVVSPIGSPTVGVFTDSRW